MTLPKNLKNLKATSMRQISFLTLAAVLSVTALSAQKVKVEIANKSIGGGNHTAYIAVIYNVKKSDVEKEWKSVVKKYSPEKVKSGGEIMADNATISSISTNTIDIYAKIKQSGNNVEIAVAFDLGGAYVDGSHKGSGTAESIVYDFAVELATIGVEDEIKGAEKLLGTKEKELEKLVKANDRLHQNIDRHKQSIKTAEDGIKQAEAEIETNEKEQEDSKKGIEEQKSSVKAISDKLKEIK